MTYRLFRMAGRGKPGVSAFEVWRRGGKPHLVCRIRAEKMYIFIQTGVSAAHDWPPIDSSYQIESSKTGGLLLSEQRRENNAFLNALAVI